MEVANYYSTLPGNKVKEQNVVRSAQTSNGSSGHFWPHQNLPALKSATCPAGARYTKALGKASWGALTELLRCHLHHYFPFS